MITQANVQDVIDAGALTADEICKGIEDDCSKLGIELTDLPVAAAVGTVPPGRTRPVLRSRDNPTRWR